MTHRKKLIEVALPLEAINIASAREKSIRHGHPSTLHLWWARRPLAAARAVIFAQMVDDPSAHPDLFPTPKAQEKERQRLFRIIEELVKWENTTNETVLQQAREEIWQSWRYTCAENADHPRAGELFDRFKLPAFHDPFAGGGALPLEAQRLGLESYASDLNPVAVLINKAMIEIPPKFAGKPPVNPGSAGILAGRDAGAPRLLPQTWRGAQGLAEDVRYYGKWMRDEAEKRIGHLYPKIEVTAEMAQDRPDLKPYVGRRLTVTAWLWARTVRSPNPAFSHVPVPLVSTFMLSTKAGKETYVEPVIEGDAYHFMVKVGRPRDTVGAKRGTSAGKRQAFTCLLSKVPISYDYIRVEANAGRMGDRLLAIVAEGDRSRVYLSPSEEVEAVARMAQPEWRPNSEMPKKHRNFQPPVYGMSNLGDIFTARQLVALTNFSDLVQEVRSHVAHEAVTAGLLDDNKDLASGGEGAYAYGDAVATFLAFALSKLLDRSCTLVTWFPERDSTYHVFGRQALPMTWDYAETNTLAYGTGSYLNAVYWEAEVVDVLVATTKAFAIQIGAQEQSISQGKIVSTDPPYYDNIGYADLSDFFYVWLRRSLRSIFPSLFATLAVPKAEELVATPHRHGSKLEAEAFFLAGMTQAMQRLAEQAHPAFPVTIYYAFKQSETASEAGTASTGWETFLDATIQAGFSLSGTWPMRTELGNRLIGKNTNALASSIILVCRKRPDDAPTATRRDFISALQAELPAALILLQRGNIAPVDLAQAAIGPGMAVYTRYAKVLDAEGKPLPVRAALALINQTLDEALAEQEGDFDADSRWAVAWSDQYGFAEGDYGVAETLSKAKNTSVGGMVEAGILTSSRGKVRLLRPDELPADWDPTTDKRLSAWEAVHQLVRALEAGGDQAAAALVTKLGSQAEAARELCYRLYTVSERKKRAADALSYNGLVQSWPEITRLAREGGVPPSPQPSLFEENEE